MNGKVCDLRKEGTNRCYEDEQGGRDQDEAVVPPTPSPPLVVEDADAPCKQRDVEP